MIAAPDGVSMMALIGPMTHHYLLPLAALQTLLFCVAGLSWAAPAQVDQGKRRPSGEDLFTHPQVLSIQIDIPEEGVRILRGYRWQGFRGGEQERPSVKATVREGDTVYRDVAVHLKGAAGSFRGIDDEPSLTLNFDKHIKKQTFHGIERFSLNNSVQDRSLLNEQICRELFAAAGVPVPRATHVKMELNGRDLGIYVLTEAFNKQFLARHFTSPEGNLYDGGFLKDVADGLSKSSGKGPDDGSDLQALADAATEPNRTNRFARLEKVLDLDRFITYLALDVMMCNWDGYAINRNNYRVYADPGSGRIVFMPHGLDQMFGVMRVGTDMPLFPRMSGLIARAVRDTPEGRRLYKQRMSQLLESHFHVEAITNRVWQLAARVRPILAEKGPGAVRDHERAVKNFCERIADRTAFIREELTAPDKTLPFGPDRVARLAALTWQPRRMHGQPVLEEASDGGKPLLHISAKSGSAVGIWTTRVQLEPGRYRLTGRVRSRGVVTDPGDRRGGAGLRISGQRFVQKLMGDTDWSEVAFDFDLGDSPGGGQFAFMGPIQDETPEVELVCELRAAKGEAWFDRDSLRLLRQ